MDLMEFVFPFYVNRVKIQIYFIDFINIMSYL